MAKQEIGNAPGAGQPKDVEKSGVSAPSKKNKGFKGGTKMVFNPTLRGTSGGPSSPSFSPAPSPMFTSKKPPAVSTSSTSSPCLGPTGTPMGMAPKKKVHAESAEDDWVLVSPADEAVLPEEQLSLKKCLWQMRICKRKPVTWVISQFEDYILDADWIESQVAEVEGLREELGGMHWTWFEEELFKGKYDHCLGGAPKERKDSSPSSESKASETMDGSFCLTTGETLRKSPTGGPQKSPKTGPLKNPTATPVLGPKDIPKEKLMAARERQHQNFLTAFLRGKTSKGQWRCFSCMLELIRTGDVINLGLANREHSSNLFGRGAMAIWHSLVPRSFVSCEEKIPPLFADNEEFQPQKWAIHCEFVADLVKKAKLPMCVAEVPELCEVDTTLGPFLPSGPCTPARLLVVFDGKQTFRVIDVKRLYSETVPVDRFSERTLYKSQGAHISNVATSWLMDCLKKESYRSCTLSNDTVLVARKTAVKSPTAEGATAFQALQLPSFAETDPEEKSTSLLRLSVSRDQVVAASESIEAGKTASVEAAWTLESSRAILLIREVMPETQASPGLSAKTSPLLKPKQTPPPSPGMGSLPDPAGAPRQWLQVWDVKLPNEANPLGAAVPLSTPLTSVKVLNKDELLIGYSTGRVEKRSVSSSGELGKISGEWQSEKSPVQFLISCEGCDGGAPTVVVSHCDCLVALNEGIVTKLLPEPMHEEIGKVCVLRPIGKNGFAVCTEASVYAFEVAKGGLPELRAVISLPLKPGFATETRRRTAAVRYFEATPYCFMVLINETISFRRGENAICCLWPPWCEAGGAEIRKMRPSNDDEEEGDVAPARHVLGLDARLPQQGWRPTKVTAICLNAYLPDARRQHASITSMHLDPYSGLLALSSSQTGTTVLWWPLQSSEEIASLRLMLKEYAKRAEESKKIEDIKRLVLKCERKLKEMDKIDEKVREKGEECLNPAEVAKRLRRPAVEEEYESAKAELAKFISNKEVGELTWRVGKQDSDDEAEKEERERLAEIERRRRKAETQSERESNSRNRKKERGKERDSKLRGESFTN